MLVPLSAFGAALIAAYWYIYSNTPSGIENTVVDTAVQYQTICQTIATNVSSQTGVHYPGSEFYTQNLYHFSASNTQQCACTVEPGSLEDVGKILQILGSTRTPFSVKSGGHSANPGFSSSEGVQIVMKRFDNIEYDPETQTVTFGTGLVFDEVYAALEPYNMTVAGARAAGIGVGGFLLGGGYSWKTNEYGLGFDYIIAYELVKPNGDVVKVTRESDPELFFGLKGGLNNFGIVTHFIMKVLPQHLVWGGTIVYPATSASDVTAAIAKFSATNTDPKGNIVASYVFGDKQFFIPVVFYYDGPSPPSGLFDDFMKIPSTVQNVHEETLTDFIRKVSLAISSGLRGGVHTVPLLEYTPHIMNVIQNETITSKTRHCAHLGRALEIYKWRIPAWKTLTAERDVQKTCVFDFTADATGVYKAYKDDIFHWASTNTAHSACSVEPGSTKDVGRILHILGESRTPFGVKSGGHTVNPGFSSSPGVQIALTRFNEIKYDSKTQTVEIGAGLIFDDVYAALERYNVSVAGGRISGIGVGGFILGGGYSWKTNRFGLALDNTVAYELVMPNGNVVKVTESSYPDLFFGLKGGYNNFGIVTQFTMKALPQPAIWAGPISYPASSVPDVTKAIIKFSATNDDPKANMVFATGFTNGETVFSGLIFYDGPRPPRGLFDDFLNIPSVSRSIHERTLTDFIKDASMAAFNGYRGIYHTVPLLKLSPNVMAAILNETAPHASATRAVLHLPRGQFTTLLLVIAVQLK
ncbi:hypothetical protein APHAL10511_005330 [Amanita phalloides]|nr:hypothetical protein APHAL10511_005330 [Amanita phalloides]